jgi:hypothetical protein
MFALAIAHLQNFFRNGTHGDVLSAVPQIFFGTGKCGQGTRRLPRRGAVKGGRGVARSRIPSDPTGLHPHPPAPHRADVARADMAAGESGRCQIGFGFMHVGRIAMRSQVNRIPVIRRPCIPMHPASCRHDLCGLRRMRTEHTWHGVALVVGPHCRLSAHSHWSSGSSPSGWLYAASVTGSGPPSEYGSTPSSIHSSKLGQSHSQAWS